MNDKQEAYRSRAGRDKVVSAGTKMAKVGAITAFVQWAAQSAADEGMILASDADLVTFLLSLWFVWWITLCLLRVGQGYYMTMYPPVYDVFWKYAHKIRGGST